MRYIVVGLGKLGSILADEFTQMGNEVIGVDKDIEKVQRIKSKIATAICLNITDTSSLSVLPQKGIYAIVIAISQDIGQSLTVYSVLKEIQGAKIYVRVKDDIQASIMKSLGISRLIFPEKDAARRYSMSLEIPYFVSSYKVDDDHYVAELKVPEGLVGYDCRADDFLKKFKLQLITVKRTKDIKNELGINHADYQVIKAEESCVLQENDIIVVYGSYKDLKEF